MQDTQAAKTKDSQTIVMKAYINAYKSMGMSDESAATESKQCELQILFIRFYRSLFALFGGDLTSMKHWFEHKNKHIRGVPRELCFTVTGLVNINAYLDALRGKA
jgi:hypothetical protein